MFFPDENQEKREFDKLGRSYVQSKTNANDDDEDSSDNEEPTNLHTYQPNGVLNNQNCIVSPT